MIKILTYVILFAASFFTTPSLLHAQTNLEESVYTGGREVLIHRDGTWRYASDDRYADTKDGNRVRLKPDGSWQYIGNALLTSKKQVRTAELDISLAKVVIETVKKKSNKSSRIKTQTVFYLDVALSSLATSDFSIAKEDISNLKVEDDTGRVYSLLAIEPSPVTLKASDKVIMKVRVDKSPSFLDDVKTMTITLLPGILNLEESVSFTQKTIDFDEQKVEAFIY